MGSEDVLALIVGVCGEDVSEGVSVVVGEPCVVEVVEAVGVVEEPVGVVEVLGGVEEIVREAVEMESAVAVVEVEVKEVDGEVLAKRGVDVPGGVIGEEFARSPELVLTSLVDLVSTGFDLVVSGGVLGAVDGVAGLVA